tara:strand:+ start:34 stop:378 length:345 start_codon:yes stop_codon:yes gene_type:complete
MSTKKVYMTDEELNAAGFGFLTKNPRIKVMPELGFEFKVEWLTVEFDRVVRSQIVSDFDNRVCGPVSETYHYENKKNKKEGEVIFIGKDIAVLLCRKTSKEFSVNIAETIFSKL